MFLWFRSTAVADKYKSAVLISGLVTFIAAYHYIRIFNSWVDAYHYSAGKLVGGAMETSQGPTLTGTLTGINGVVGALSVRDHVERWP